jgi:hypothetical protein
VIALGNQLATAQPDLSTYAQHGSFSNLHGRPFAIRTIALGTFDGIQDAAIISQRH